MSNIEQNLQKILSSRYGKDVRQSIHDSIHDCYEDGKAGAVDLVARERINNLVANNNPTEGNSELIDIRVGADGNTYPNAGDAVREQVSSLKEDLYNKYWETGNNIFNKNKVRIGIYSVDGIYVGDSNYVTTDYLVYVGNRQKHYIASINNSIFTWFDKDGVFLSRTENTKYSHGRRIPTNAYYLAIAVARSHIDAECVLISEIQFTSEVVYEEFVFKPRYVDYVEKEEFENVSGRLDAVENIVNDDDGIIKSQNMFNESLSNKNTIVNVTDGTLSANDNYETSDYIDVSEMNLYYYASNYNGRACFYDENKAFLSGIENSLYTHNRRIPSGSKFMKISIGSSKKKYCLWISKDKITQNPIYEPYGTILYNANMYFGSEHAGENLKINELGYAEPIPDEVSEREIDYMLMFHRLCGIGDSLMSGAIEDGAGTGESYAYSWLSNIGRTTGAEVSHYSKSGYTTKTCIQQYQTQIESSVPCNAYFIATGTNDYSKNPYADGLGVYTDTTDTDSFCGTYKKLIEIIRNHAPNAKIFCMSLYSDISIYLPYSSAIEQICETYDGVYFIDFANNGEYLLKMGNPYVSGGHYNAFGYVQVANVIKDLANKVIKENLDDFKFIELSDIN